MAHVRSRGLLAKGCASTGLAASVYDDFSTAHALFAIPVIDDEEDFDLENDFKCNLHLPKYAERVELINSMTLCAWDEISSQHMRDIRAVYAAVNSFAGKILIFCGDALQITPVVKGGNKSAICASSIYCSELMTEAHFYKFTKILRLQNVDVDPAQAAYAYLLDCISNNTLPTDSPYTASLPFHIACDEQHVDGIFELYIPHLKPLFTEDEVVVFCFPDGFDTTNMHKSCILAGTNIQVDSWNAKIQLLNNMPMWSLLSKDSINMCDDPHGYIAAMITEEVMNAYEDPATAPSHVLKLKLNDICILMRAVSKVDKLATNTRVRIVGISHNIVRVSTLGDNPKFANLPRFIFTLKMPYGKSFEVTRRQFPLRLAYSLSMNRSQGQTFDNRVVVDLTKHCFMHGHLNVALSRIRNSANIAVHIFESDYDAQNNMVITTNVVYPEIIAAVEGNL
jgi:hypothetical protein